MRVHYSKAIEAFEARGLKATITLDGILVQQPTVGFEGMEHDDWLIEAMMTFPVCDRTCTVDTAPIRSWLNIGL